VLAADPELDPRLRAPAALDRHAHQLAHALDVEHLERVALEDALLEVVGEELPLRVVAGEAEGRLGEVVRPEREEVRQLCDLVGAHAGPRQFDHRPDQMLGGRLLQGDTLGQVAQPAELLSEPDERVHDLDERRLAGPIAHSRRRPDDRADLHLVDLGVLEPETAAAGAEHGVRLAQLVDPPPHLVRRRLLGRRKELVQRRVEEADRDGKPGHRLEDPLEVRLLDGEQAVERRAARRLV